MKHIKILYGAYETYQKAKQDLEGLKPNLRSVCKPYIDKLQKHKNLYKKYNSKE
jgi:hypothetical protein